MPKIIMAKCVYHQIKAATKSELNVLAHRISKRVTIFLEREGLLVRDVTYTQ